MIERYRFFSFALWLLALTPHRLPPPPFSVKVNAKVDIQVFVTHIYVNTWSEPHANDPYVALWSSKGKKKNSSLSDLRVNSTATLSQGSQRLWIIQRALFKLIHSC